MQQLMLESLRQQSSRGQPVKADAIKALDANESSAPAAEWSIQTTIQSAVRTISILLAVADSPNGLKAKEIMEKLGYRAR